MRIASNLALLKFLYVWNILYIQKPRKMIEKHLGRCNIRLRSRPKWTSAVFRNGDSVDFAVAYKDCFSPACELFLSFNNTTQFHTRVCRCPSASFESSSSLLHPLAFRNGLSSYEHCVQTQSWSCRFLSASRPVLEMLQEPHHRPLHHLHDPSWQEELWSLQQGFHFLWAGMFSLSNVFPWFFKRALLNKLTRLSRFHDPFRRLAVLRKTPLMSSRNFLKIIPIYTTLMRIPTLSRSSTNSSPAVSWKTPLLAFRTRVRTRLGKMSPT